MKIEVKPSYSGGMPSCISVSIRHDTDDDDDDVLLGRHTAGCRSVMEGPPLVSVPSVRDYVMYWIGVKGG